MHVELSQVIHRPVAEVFTFYARDHVTNHPRWDPDMHLEQLTDGPIGVGTVIRRVTMRSGAPVEGSMEIVEYEPNRLMVAVIRDGPVEWRGRATFTPVSADETELRVTVDIAGMDESARETMTRLIRRSLGNIRSLVESSGRRR